MDWKRHWHQVTQLPESIVTISTQTWNIQEQINLLVSFTLTVSNIFNIVNMLFWGIEPKASPTFHPFLEWKFVKADYTWEDVLECIPIKVEHKTCEDIVKEFFEEVLKTTPPPWAGCNWETFAFIWTLRWLLVWKEIRVCRYDVDKFDECIFGEPHEFGTGLQQIIENLIMKWLEHPSLTIEDIIADLMDTGIGILKELAKRLMERIQFLQNVIVNGNLTGAFILGLACPVLTVHFSPEMYLVPVYWMDKEFHLMAFSTLDDFMLGWIVGISAPNASFPTLAGTSVFSQELADFLYWRVDRNIQRFREAWHSLLVRDRMKRTFKPYTDVKTLQYGERIAIRQQLDYVVRNICDRYGISPVMMRAYSDFAWELYLSLFKQKKLKYQARKYLYKHVTTEKVIRHIFSKYIHMGCDKNILIKIAKAIYPMYNYEEIVAKIT